MTKRELQQFVQKNLRKNPDQMIDTETGLAALRRTVAVADRKGVAWALVGGIAMHLYGSPRILGVSGNGTPALVRPG